MNQPIVIITSKSCFRCGNGTSTHIKKNKIIHKCPFCQHQWRETMFQKPTTRKLFTIMLIMFSFVIFGILFGRPTILSNNGFWLQERKQNND